MQQTGSHQHKALAWGLAQVDPARELALGATFGRESPLEEQLESPALPQASPLYCRLEL